MKVKAVTLGCKVNTYESEYILSSFKDKGYLITNELGEIYIINTCSVTNTSDAKSRKVINRIVRENPNSVIVVMGCMVEAHKDYLNDGVSIIIGNKDKSRVVELVEDYLKTKEKKKLLYADFDHVFEDMFITNMTSHTRAFVKIQDGCENFCSYCIIPYTRGRVRSKNKDKVIKEVDSLVKNGYKEIVLTGIHTGHYGSDIETSFPELLIEILKNKDLERLRISSIEITELDDLFLEVLEKYPVIVDHMHIPLQAGSDNVLQSMNRKYLTDYFYDKIQKIRKIRPNISITTDIIVGFPGESDADFNETLEFVNKIKFTKVHVFPYSRRRGTKADLMPNQIPDVIKKERVKKLMKLSDLLEIEYLDSYLKKVVKVLVETSDESSSIGHTDNYLKVIVNKKLEVNKIVEVIIDERREMTLIGHLK